MAGVTTSLCTSVVALLVVVFSIREKVAATPLTVTESTLRVLAARLPLEPWKSRENDDSGAPVVAAWMVACALGRLVVACALWTLDTVTSTRKLMS